MGETEGARGVDSLGRKARAPLTEGGAHGRYSELSSQTWPFRTTVRRSTAVRSIGGAAERPLYGSGGGTTLIHCGSLSFCKRRKSLNTTASDGTPSERCRKNLAAS